MKLVTSLSIMLIGAAAMGTVFAESVKCSVGKSLGSFYKTCSNCDLDKANKVISAQCKKKNGELNSTSINYSRCKKLENIDGNLKCTKY